MRVMIADDEGQIRKGLRLKIQHLTDEFTVISEASNGEEALLQLAETPVDIVITDMRMPVMDGLQFAKRCAADYPAVKVIVLSGYSEYDYVRNSLKEGVFDYLLKPVAPDELLEVLVNVRKAIMLEREQLQEQQLEQLQALRREQEAYLAYITRHDLVYGIRERVEQLQMMELLGGETYVVSLEGRCMDVEQLQEKWSGFLQQLTVGDVVRYAFPAAAPYRIHLLSTGTQQKTLDWIKKTSREAEKSGLCLAAGVSRAVKEIGQIRKGCLESLYALDQTSVAPRPVISRFDQPADRPSGVSVEWERRLLAMLEQGNLPAFQSFIQREWRDRQQDTADALTGFVQHVLRVLQNVMAQQKMDNRALHHRIWQCRQQLGQPAYTDDLPGELCSIAAELMEENKDANSTTAAIVESIRAYIDTHYGDELSLTMLSERFHLNSAYLSEMFKRHTGQNFSEYMARVRTEKAEQLLTDPHLKMIDIAQLTGFSSASYFSTFFKKQTGVTPVEFRRSAALPGGMTE